MFERFTDRARRVVVLAQEEARMLGHGYIGTEHLLLGLVSEGEGIAAQTLEALGVSSETVQTAVRSIVGQGDSAPGGHIPFTPRAKKVLEMSLKQALQLGHEYIGTEHILLGLFGVKEGVAAQVLQQLGVDQKSVRQHVLGLLAEGPEAVRKEAVELPTEARGARAEQAPCCPRCQAPLGTSIAFRTLSVGEQSGAATRDVVVVFCTSCGTALGTA